MWAYLTKMITNTNSTNIPIAAVVYMYEASFNCIIIVIITFHIYQY